MERILWYDLPLSAAPWIGTFLSGSLIGGVVAKLLDLKLEFIREKRKRRSDLIAEWRSDFFPRESKEIVYPANLRNWIYGRPSWLTISAHLSSEYKRRLADMNYDMETMRWDFPFHFVLVEEINRIERKWKLI